MNHEVFKLDCCYCSHIIELPAGSAEAMERLICPRCGSSLFIDWRGRSRSAHA